MDYYQIISEHFQDTVETIAASVDNLAGPIELASGLMARGLLEDHKIMACGNGVDGTLAQAFSINLMSRFENDRPALPALALNNDGANLTAIARAGSVNDIYSRQVRALGHAGDVLLCINSSGFSNDLSRAIQAAHERGMGVVVLSSSRDGELVTLLQSDDVELQVDSLRQPRTVELHTMIVHCLCVLIEHSLFGSYERE